MPSPSQANIDQLIAMAARNVCEGVFYEPRLWFDSIAFPGTAGSPVLQRSNPNTFQNGEKYPVRITHLLFSVRPSDTDGSGDERILSRYSCRVNVQDTFYMNSGLEGTGIPIPLWQNVPSAASDTVTQSTSSWVFGRPFILGARDSMVVRLTLEQSSGNAGVRTCGASFSGYGLFSKRPYFFAGTVELSLADKEVTVDPGSYISDSGEPVVMTNMTLFCGAGIDDSNPVGDIQQLRARIRQAESGTGQFWSSGPPMPPPIPGAMGPLWGTTTGRAVVHELPWVPGQDNPGWLFEPGMNAVVELYADDPDQQENIAVAMSGYAIIT